MTHNRGFTWIEALVLLLVAAILLVILLAILGSLRRQTSSTQHATALRGIHQGMVIFAQSNKAGSTVAGYYPGLNPDGSDGELNVEDRFLALLNANAFMPEYLINPVDSAKTKWQSGPFTSDHYSYAMLQIPPQGARRAEWRETLSPSAIVLADRNTGTAAQPTSVWNKRTWSGTVTRNDGSTTFESTHLHNTQYDTVVTPNDHLFEAAGDDDAYLIHSGN